MSEQGLKALEDPEIFRRCFEDSTDAIILPDLKGRIVRANGAWLELHGYTLEEVVGQTTRLVRSEHSTREMYEHMWSQIRDPKRGFWKGEVVNRTRSGEDVPLLLTITPIRRDGEITGYMGIGIDIRERKQLEELKRLYDLVVWHDLKAPLTTVLGTLDILLGGYVGEMDPKQREMLERARRQGKRMQELIATSLDLEKLKRRQLQLDLQEVDLVSALRAALEAQAMVAKRRVSFELLVDGHPATDGERILWLLDPVHLQRCLDNLVKNAAEASPQGATVRACVDRTEAGIRVRVHNDGLPIPPDVRATLFHPFGTYGKRGGTGLGLYGVKLLVEAMGGTVGYETGEQGTEFEVRWEKRADRRPSTGGGEAQQEQAAR